MNTYLGGSSGISFYRPRVGIFLEEGKLLMRLTRSDSFVDSILYGVRESCRVHKISIFYSGFVSFALPTILFNGEVDCCIDPVTFPLCARICHGL